MTPREAAERIVEDTAARDARITALRKAVRWVLDHPSQRIPAWVYEAME